MSGLDHHQNQCLGAWSKVFGDQAIASAILDRLLHHSITININLSAQGKTEVAGLQTKNRPTTRNYITRGSKRHRYSVTPPTRTTRGMAEFQLISTVIFG
jgi:IstB-like ATP binding protein